MADNEITSDELTIKDLAVLIIGMKTNVATLDNSITAMETKFDLLKEEVKKERRKIKEELSDFKSDVAHWQANYGGKPEKSTLAPTSHGLLEPRSNWQRKRTYGN